MWMNQICRLCAQVSEVLFPIFERTGDRPRLDIKIKKCLSLMITETDQKPKQICYNCVTKLEDFHDFLDACQTSDYKFESILYTSAPLEAQSHNARWLPDKQTQLLQLTNEPQQNQGVIMVGKMDDTSNINQDILLMVELKYNEQNNIMTELNQVTTHSTAAQTKPFPCTVCNKSFMRRTNLNAHMSTHTQIKPYKCDKCERSFALKWNLKVHERIHLGLFVCEFCKKAFPVRGKLDRHRRVHTGEKPFVCSDNTCNKAFSDKRNLEAHIKTHSEEKPYVCAVCGKSFRSKSHVTDHQRVHSSETPYTCEACGKSFKWKTNLTIHMRAHSGQKSVCFCGKEFTRSSQLVKHRKVVHGE